jgi:hypothetical protein
VASAKSEFLESTEEIEGSLRKEEISCQRTANESF